MIDRSPRTPELQRSPRTGFRSNEVATSASRRPGGGCWSVCARVGLLTELGVSARLPRAREMRAIKVNEAMRLVGNKKLPDLIS